MIDLLLQKYFTIQQPDDYGCVKCIGCSESDHIAIKQFIESKKSDPYNFNEFMWALMRIGRGHYNPHQVKLFLEELYGTGTITK